jgi:glyoxylase-like metal-dependent hydrolase (beta-lactamase superfamily II)
VREGEAMSGISAVALPGHTPGHTGWLIASGKESLLIWGDLVRLASVQVARPDTGLVFDVDPQQACATRRRAFDRVAADKLMVAGAHMAFPGFGTIVRKGAGFAFEAEG